MSQRARKCRGANSEAVVTAHLNARARGILLEGAGMHHSPEDPTQGRDANHGRKRLLSRHGASANEMPVGTDAHQAEAHDLHDRLREGAHISDAVRVRYLSAKQPRRQSAPRPWVPITVQDQDVYRKIGRRKRERAHLVRRENHAGTLHVLVTAVRTLCNTLPHAGEGRVPMIACGRKHSKGRGERVPQQR